MPTLTNTPAETPEYLSDDAEGCALTLIDELGKLGGAISNFLSVTNDQNDIIYTDPAIAFQELLD